MNNQYQNTQDAFAIINSLAALCATSGITEDTTKLANASIQKLITSVIDPAITKLSATSAGIITKS